VQNSEALIVAWCERELGGRPVELLFATAHMSDVIGVRLDDGRPVVIKSRPDEAGRAGSCVTVQRVLAERGLPVARPLTNATVVEGLAIHAEEWRPGGDILRGDGPEIAAKFGSLMADVVTRAKGVNVRPPLPNPVWLCWDHNGSGVWPPYDWHDARADQVPVPEYIEDTAIRALNRLRRADLPFVLGHGDWEAQNIRWKGSQPYAIHDWDSLAWLPEAAMAGAAAGAFASAENPTLAPLESSACFLDMYQQTARRAFTFDELQVAWAASLWLATHNARTEALYETAPIAGQALLEQADARLLLAGA
jgi:phosphotransferase family enzyme